MYQFKVSKAYTAISLQMSPENKVAIQVLKTTQFSPGKVVIITGGLGGLGLEMALWMVERGATHIILTSRSGVKTGYQRMMIRRMEERGCRVLVSNYDVSDFNQTRELFFTAAKMGPIVGIFHLAAVSCSLSNLHYVGGKYIPCPVL